MERVNKDRRAKRGEVIANYKYSISERERYYSSMVFGVGIILMCYGSIFMINLLLGILSEINGEELTHMFPHMLTLFVNIPLYIIIGLGYIYVILTYGVKKKKGKDIKLSHPNYELVEDGLLNKERGRPILTLDDYNLMV